MKYSDNLGLSARLEQLVGNSLHSDFTFIIEDENVEIPAHKLILALSSAVFDKIVYGNDVFIAKNSIKIDGISKKSFMEILRYIYTDNINLDEDNIIEILYKANYFGLPAIEAKCYDYIEINLSVSTVPKFFHHLFYTSPPPELLNKCMQCIRIEPLSFFAAEEFPSLSIAAFKLILQMNAINCTEVDLFEALIKLARNRCIMEDLHPAGANQRKVLDGAEDLLRMDSLTASEFDKCVSIEPDFFTSKEIERIHQNVENINSMLTQRRKQYTYQDAVWLKISNTAELPPYCFSYDSAKCIYRCLKQGANDTPVVLGDFNELENIPNGSSYTIEILCGSGYEWRRCVSGEIPIGAVCLSPKSTTPVFIGRGYSKCPGAQIEHIAPVQITGKMYIPEYQRYSFLIFNYTISDPFELSEFEILVANNFKNREKYSAYIGNGVPNNAVLIESDENNFSTYFGRAWYNNTFLPVKIIFENGSLVTSYVSYNNDKIEVDEFSFLCMDPGTFEWQSKEKNGEVPDNVIIGFEIPNRTLYFGRCWHKETYTYGVINLLHKSLYAFFKHGHRIYPETFEYLVHRET